MKIIINGRRHDTALKVLTYEVLLVLANKPKGSTVTWSRGPAAQEAGSLLPGEVVGLRSGQVFNVQPTTKS